MMSSIEPVKNCQSAPALLILSVLAGSAESVSLLLEARADIDIRNNKRERATDLAELGNNKTIIELLRKHKDEKKVFGIF